MTYVYDLEDGQRLILQNEERETLVALSSDDEGQQQSQSTAFDTGKWSKTPELFRAGGSLLLRVESKNGMKFIRVGANQIQLMSSEPDLAGAEKLQLKESAQSIAMKPLEPLKPIEPMKPMKPMKPMEGMGPMEMRMGGMHMSMGAAEKETPTEKRFCSQCGKPVQSGDRFCASCGHSLVGQ